MAGIYLHIPFCKTRCIYCDFFSSTRDDLRRQYVTALCTELEQRQPYLQNAPINTIYFGGGTPSQLQEEDFAHIFKVLYKVYGAQMPNANQMEITLEANPDDITHQYLNMLQKFPFNRISMGVQSFHDEQLIFLHRRHTAQQARNAVNLCREHQFDNISIDLIYGLPGQTEEEWTDDLQQAINLKPPHLSAYHLTIEEGTALWQLKQSGTINETDEALSVRMFKTLRTQLLNAGYEHYEISNFALPGKQAQHNSSYWDGTPYIGVGAAAHSFNGTSRQWNPRNLELYIKGITEHTLQPEIETLSRAERYDDYIITALRTAKGVSLHHIATQFGEQDMKHCLQCAAPYIHNGLLIHQGDTLRLTPEGIFLSDGIMTNLLSDEDEV